MDVIRNFIEKARENPARIVYPEGRDIRIVVAASKVKEMGIAEPIILGSRNDIEKAASEQNVSVDGIRIISLGDEDAIEKYAEDYAKA